ncbi:ABC transporter permease, partial [Rhizobiaceae sp. 2RAB30]
MIGLVAAFAFDRLLGTGAAAMVPWAALVVVPVAWLLALAAILLPALMSSRLPVVAVGRIRTRRDSSVAWRRYWIDAVVLALAALAFWQSSSSGYQIVLAPEGVPAASVDYAAFLAPALFWIGSALLTIRLSSALIGSNGKALDILVRPVAGRLSALVAASLAHQQARVTTGIATIALAVAFAVSTAIFNATYQNQAHVDAELTNGADVSVFGTAARPASAHLAVLSALPGVVAAEPMLHRFAYVGADLQDLYGIDPRRLGRATSLEDSYFRGGSADEIMARLAATPDGLLVSEETVSDFQLRPGDTVKLRLMSLGDNQYHVVPFRLVGVAREFPTAPRDSFLVANASYIAGATGSDQAEYVLMRAAVDPAQLARTTRAVLVNEPSLRVKDSGAVSRVIASS